MIFEMSRCLYYSKDVVFKILDLFHACSLGTMYFMWVFCHMYIMYMYMKLNESQYYMSCVVIHSPIILSDKNIIKCVAYEIFY